MFAAETIERLVVRTYHEYRHAKIQTYLSLLVEREVEARLTAIDYDYPSPPPEAAAPAPEAAAPAGDPRESPSDDRPSPSAR